MKKINLLIIFTLAFSLPSVFSQNRSIRFLEKPWLEILQTAKKENKMIFLDAYAAWCGPCKWMAANIFTNDTVADYFNETFICAKVDMEKGEGPRLAMKFDVKAYPSLLFIDTSGALVHKKVGADKKAQDYIKLAGIARDPEQCLAYYIKQYNAGFRSPDFMLNYFDRLTEAYASIEIPLKQYLSSMPDSALLSLPNWNIIYKYVNDKNSKAFGFLLSHRLLYEQLYSPDSVRQKIWGVYANALVQSIRSQPFSQDKYEQLREEILKSGFILAPELLKASDQWLQQYKGVQKQ